MREMLIQTTSANVRDLHRDVWRMAHCDSDVHDGRSFQFALISDGHVLIRGPHLPGPHSRPMASLTPGEQWRFLIDVRTVTRNNNREAVLPQTAVPAWFAARLPGFVVESESLRVSLPRRRAFEDGRTLPYRTIAGVIRVTDAAQAEQAVRTGVGRSKAFGFGMLLLTECLNDGMQEQSAGPGKAAVEA